ncbi:MAG: competence protein ComEA [Cyclobacteriaceae bacterium]|jgi:DNA uptake protein ComE-like DNA-binding protein
MMIFRKWLVDILGFSKSEAIGTILLIILVILTAIVPRVVFYYHENQATFNFDNQKELEEWGEIVSANIAYRASYSAEKATKKANRKKLSPVFFDPNTVLSEELISMGLDQWIAERIEKYVNKGGTFLKKEDLKKIYGLDKDSYDQLAPFIKIKPPINEPPIKGKVITKTKSIPLVILDINTADTSQLKSIHGIGEKLSARIIKYRDRLGGFHSLSQLHEVYGLDSVVINKMEQRFSREQIQNKISINTDSNKLLSGHPYINYKLARAIVNYRKTHGDYKGLKDLKNILTLNDSTYQKILPYLRLTP